MRSSPAFLEARKRFEADELWMKGAAEAREAEVTSPSWLLFHYHGSTPYNMELICNPSRIF